MATTTICRTCTATAEPRHAHDLDLPWCVECRTYIPGNSDREAPWRISTGDVEWLAEIDAAILARRPQPAPSEGTTPAPGAIRIRFR